MNSRPRAVPVVLVVVATVAAAGIAACRAPRPSSRPTVEVSTCPPPNGADTASLNIVIRTEPAPREGAEATIRLEGETQRTSVRVNPAEAMRFSLVRGIYDARVSLDGYGTAVGRATLTGGCQAEMTVTLRR